jgi:RimJ/RimL family protein N-acetyltransferase
MIISTPRTQLRCWQDADRDAFAAMHADPEVMQDYGGPISRRESEASSTAMSRHIVNMAFAAGQSKAGKALFSVTLASCPRASIIRSVHISRSVGD